MEEAQQVWLLAFLLQTQYCKYQSTDCTNFSICAWSLTTAIGLRQQWALHLMQRFVISSETKMLSPVGLEEKQKYMYVALPESPRSLTQ